ncbi:hypothetical protein ACIRQP_35565 [Streptomyces sp. NPDC102274]|uniref:hypothetical protein n=1 Tax=Streptomyces sp. NPDC102274 TaxID=3366151 RepID=UPI0037F140AD
MYRDDATTLDVPIGQVTLGVGVRAPLTGGHGEEPAGAGGRVLRGGQAFARGVGAETDGRPRRTVLCGAGVSYVRDQNSCVTGRG